MRVGAHRRQLRARPSSKAVLLFAVVAMAACRKPEEDIGLDLLPEEDALGTIVMDTARIVAWTVRPEAVRTSALTRNLLGTYMDPDFGAVTTGMAFQVRLSSSSVGPFDPTNVCDSLVLSLAYEAGNYGYGSRNEQGFRVFRIAEDLSTDSTYRADQPPASQWGDLLGGTRNSFPIDPVQGPVIGGDTLVPQLRLPLKKELGDELLSHWGGDVLVDNSLGRFMGYFKGLLVVPVAEAEVPYQQAVLHFNLLNPQSKLTLYYHNDTASFTYDLIINTSSVRYSVGRHDHAKALRPQLPAALADTALGQQHVYLQALGGLRGELRFPGLENYRDNGHGALAKAELIMPIEGDVFPLYAPPSQIFVFRKDDEGNDAAIPDQLVSGNQVGGTWDADAKEYRLVITQWLQGVINGEYPNTGLSIVPGSNGVSVNRAILAGPENPVDRMRLRLTFTTY